MLLGSHSLKAYTRKQKIIARCSAEAELCAAELRASESIGVVSLLKDLGYEMKPVFAIDAKATEHILHRQEIGRLKHIDVAYLWMQDEVRSMWLRVRRVKCEEHVANLGTRPLSKAVFETHSHREILTWRRKVLSQCKLHDVAMFRDFGSIHMIVTDGRTAGDHVKTSSSAVRNSSNGSCSRIERRSRNISLEAIHMLYPVEEYTVQ